MLKKISVLLALCLALPAQSANQEPVKVVASFSIVADIVKQVGGDAVDVHSLVASGVDSHTFRPTPKSVVKVKKADLLVMNGLDFETWMPRVVSASGFKGDTLVLGDAINAIEISAEEAHHHDHHGHHGEEHHDEHGDDEHEKHGDHDDKHDDHHHNDGHKDEHHDHKHDDHHNEKGHKEDHHDEHEGDADKVYYDPHAWQDLSKAAQYVDAIAVALIKQRPAQAKSIQARADAYKKELLAVDAAFKERTKNIPQSLRKVVTDHNAFEYFARAYNVEFYAVRGLSTESGASAKDVSRVIREMKENKVRLIFLEAMTNTKLSKQIAKEANVKVAGKLYTGVLPKSGPASTYLGMMTHNLNAVAEGLESLQK